MNHRKQRPTFALVIILLASFQFSLGQFQYIGTEFGFGTSAKGMMRAQLSLSYLNQFSTKHGLGVELTFPRSIDRFLTDEIAWKPNSPWEGYALWSRAQLPSIGLRYRYFNDNNLFFGGVLSLGYIREVCYVNRDYAVTTNGTEIMPILLDYRMFNGFVGLSGEFGFHWPIGQYLFMSAHVRGGPQFTVSPVVELGTISTQDGDQILSAYRGFDLVGMGIISFGLKI